MFVESDEAVANKLRASQEIKYVQYVPRDMGKQNVDLNNALRSLYQTDYTNISKKAKRRYDPSNRISGYLYQNHGETCQSSHRHS